MNLDEHKKLAAAVAERLGGDWTAEYVLYDIEHDLWALAGACIDRAQECGWELSVHRGDVLFRQIDYVGYWGSHSVGYDGYPLAILHAFADIPLEHFGVKR